LSGSGAQQPAQDCRILRQGDQLILEATFDPLNGRGLLALAAVRRALATRQPIRASRRISTDRALWDHNWDSNAVLCETWQIPGVNTSRAAE
jgi:hypothetical protein